MRTLAWALRLGALASLGGACWAIYKINATPDGGGLPYFLFWTPLFLGIAVVLLVTSFLLGSPAESNARKVPLSRGLNLWVHILAGIGVVALLGEAVVIFTEGKISQAVELVFLSSAIAAFRWWVHRLPPQRQRFANLLTILALVALGLGWWWILQLVLGIFDR